MSSTGQSRSALENHGIISLIDTRFLSLPSQFYRAFHNRHIICIWSVTIFVLLKHMLDKVALSLTPRTFNFLMKNLTV
jgi:hypothetical protein